MAFEFVEVAVDESEALLPVVFELGEVGVERRVFEELLQLLDFGVVEVEGGVLLGLVVLLGLGVVEEEEFEVFGVGLGVRGEAEVAEGDEVPLVGGADELDGVVGVFGTLIFWNHIVIYKIDMIEM